MPIEINLIKVCNNIFQATIINCYTIILLRGIYIVSLPLLWSCLHYSKFMLCHNSCPSQVPFYRLLPLFFRQACHQQGEQHQPHAGHDVGGHPSGKACFFRHDAHGIRMAPPDAAGSTPIRNPASRLTTIPARMEQMPLKKKVTKPVLRRRVLCCSMMFLDFSRKGLFLH
jgi:hypothetical protein